MVTFTCNACGSSLKKIKVEKHLYQCKTHSLSCIDCGKDFDNKSYDLHKQCITEDEKYGNKAKQTSNKPTESKGQIKQEQWVNHIRSVIAEANLQEPMKGMMNRLLEFSNIPKKKPKFLNFVNNCMKIGNKKYTEQMWELFNKSIEQQSNGTTKSNEKNVQGTEGNKKREAQEEIIQKAKKIKNDEKDDLNGEEEQEEVIKKAKKIKTDEKNDLNGGEKQEKQEKQEEENVESYEEGKQKLKMIKVIKKVLKENDSEMPIKKLRKRVLKEFKSNDEEFDKKQLEMKFEDRINSSKFVIEDGKIKLAKK